MYIRIRMAKSFNAIWGLSDHWIFFGHWTYRAYGRVYFREKVPFFAEICLEDYKKGLYLNVAKSYILEGSILR